MTEKLIRGCYPPRDTNLRQTYERLVQIYAPVVYFDPEERFFPVDLSSAVAVSALYRKATELVADYGNITPNDLDLAESDCFATVVGWIEEEHPIPKIDDIYNKYSTGAIPARLTTYATVCTPKEVPNYDFLEQFPPAQDIRNALAEGLLINYYFNFPASESPELKREGDWSGISILFRGKPELDHLEKSTPVLTCYFKKIGDVIVAGADGFRSWNNVARVRDQETGLETHPVVYISKGRHNCYYDPVNVTIPVVPPLWNAPDPTKIEGGGYAPAPASITVTGSWDQKFPAWTYAIFNGLMLLFELCGHLGCGAEFDVSGLPVSGYSDGNDSVQTGGYESAPDSAQTGVPAGSDGYPSGPPTPGVPVNLKLNVVYVDLYDQATRANWGYKGYWGAATVGEYNWLNPDKTIGTYSWGTFGGFRRPNLGPWFLWNLYWDPTFGSAGGRGYRTPGP